MLYSQSIQSLLAGLTELRVGQSPEVARELSIAITALEDAQMRVNRAGLLMEGGEITPSDML